MCEEVQNFVVNTCCESLTILEEILPIVICNKQKTPSLSFLLTFVDVHEAGIESIYWNLYKLYFLVLETSCIVV